MSSGDLHEHPTVDDDDDRRVDLDSRARVVALEARYRKAAVALFIAIGVLGFAVTGAVIGLFSLVHAQHDSRVRALTAVCVSTNRTNRAIRHVIVSAAPALRPTAVARFPITQHCGAYARRLAD